jgi:hypothetical protein
MRFRLNGAILMAAGFAIVFFLYLLGSAKSTGTDHVRAAITRSTISHTRYAMMLYFEQAGGTMPPDGASLVRAVDLRGVGTEEGTVDRKRAIIFDAWGRPLVIRRVGDEWIIYSTGPDGIDNDRKGDDITWDGPLEIPPSPHLERNAPAIVPASGRVADEDDK